MIIALFMIMLDVSVVTVALSDIAKNLNASVQDASWVLSAYTLVFAANLIVAGRLGDHFGRKKIFVVGLLIFMFASVACGLSQNITTLIVFRAVQALGASFIMPATLSFVSLLFPPEKRGMAMGIWGVTSGISSALGPAIGGFITHNFSWHYIFFLNVPLSIIAIAGVVLVFAESKDEKKAKLDILGAFLNIILLLFLTFGITIITDPKMFVFAVLSLVLFLVSLIAFIVHEKRLGEEALLELSLFKERSFTIGVICGFILMFGMMGVFYLMPYFWQHIGMLNPAQAGVNMLPMTVSMLVITPFVGRLSDKTKPKYLMIGGSLLSAIGVAIVCMQMRIAPPSSSFFVGMLLAGLGMAFLQTPLTTSVMASIPPSKAGAGSGVLTSSRQVGSLIAVALMTMIISGTATPGVIGLKTATNIQTGLLVIVFAYSISAALLFLVKGETIKELVNRKS
ncbi:MAG: MFS transporter [Coriobacteriia bacterium]|nr:MFS transporter [Coriobacteriia bacterium]